MATAKMTFEKAKAQAVKAANKAIAKAEQKYGNAKYDREDLAIIERLQDFPGTSKEIRGLDVKYKAIFLKAHMAAMYPDNTFKAQIDRYSMGAGIDVYYSGPVIPQQALRSFEKLYADRGNTDSQTDYFDYDNHCHISREDMPGVSGPIADTGAMVVKA